MPNKNNNPGHMRGWSQNQLSAVLEVIQRGISIHQASIQNDISKKTLERRFKFDNVLGVQLCFCRFFPKFEALL